MEINDLLKLKFVLIGPESVGKTCYLSRLESNGFKEEYEPTIGVNLGVLITNYNGKNIKYQFWDTSGNERFRSISTSYYRGSDGIIAFYDISNKESFDSLKKQLNEDKASFDENKSVLIIGNKTDLEDQRQVGVDEAELFAKENNYLFIEISVKNSTNLNEALNKITEDSIPKLDLTRFKSTTSRSVNFALPKIVNEATFSFNSSRSPRIDAMSNSLLISSVNVYNRHSDLETRKFIADLIDQVKMLKTDVDKKDKLITKLSSMRETSSVRYEESVEVKVENALKIERKAFESVKREIEVKYETIANEFAEEKAKNLLKNDKLNELKNEMESLKSQITDLNALNDSKSIKISELEQDLQSYESVGTKSSLTINALQTDNKELQMKILELESTLRTTQTEREEYEKKLVVYSEKIRKFSSNISLSTETFDAENIDIFSSKYQEVKTESLQFKNQFTEINEKFVQSEAQNKIFKETLITLKTDFSNLEREILELKISLETAKSEREAALTSKEIIEKEVEFLKEKLINTQQVWLSATKELDSNHEKCSTIETRIKNMELDTSNYKLSFDYFKEEISKLLSDDYFKVEPTEDEIKEKIKLLMLSSKHRGLMIASLENKIQALSLQLEIEFKEKAELKSKNESNLSIINVLDDKIFDLESKLSESKASIELYNNERSKVLVFIDRLSHAFNLTSSSFINSIENLERNLNFIVAKVELKQINKIETKQVSFDSDKSSLESKLSLYKDQLINKDIHLDLLRKKVADLEEDKFGRSELKTEFENICRENKKMNIQIVRLNDQLSSFKTENTQLKSQLLDINNLRFEGMNKDSEISKLNIKIAELESSNNKNLSRIADLREEIDSTSSELSKTVKNSDIAIKAISFELRALKLDYEKSKSRESQLLDFRNVVAKKVGLDMNSLSIADYEIVARIESFVNGHVHMITHFPTRINHISTL